MNKISLVFFGSWKNAPIVFRAAVNEPIFDVKLAVTGDNPPEKKPNLIITLAGEKNIPAVSWPAGGNTAGLLEKLKQLDPDFLLITDFGYKIPKEIIDLPRFGAVNIHPSLLPKYRGTTPVQAAILNGDKEIGVSVMLIDDKFDHGPLLAQAKMPLEPTATAPVIYQKLFEIGAKMLPQVLQGIKKNGRIVVGRQKDFPSSEPASTWLWQGGGESFCLKYFNPPQPQDDTKATYTKMLKKEMGRIDWLKSPVEIERRVRAYTGWPGSWTTLHDLFSWKDIKSQKFDLKSEKRIKIIKTHLSENEELVIDRLQIEGKKPISWAEFARGHLQ